MALKFGTDGVRDIAGTVLTPEFAMKLGQAAAAALVPDGRGLILIGKDPRTSSDMLEGALAAGICSVGVSVMLLGVIPTPAVAYLMKLYNANAGIMVSASHNPFEYNGIKMFGASGAKLSDAEQDELTEHVYDAEFPKVRACGGNVGTVLYAKAAIEDYVEHLYSAANGDFDGAKVVFDGANGAASKTIELLAQKLKIDAAYMNIEPNGLNINEKCGSTYPKMLQAAVLEQGAQLGIAFDGDADRIIVVDENGDIQDGDKLLAIFASYLAKNGNLKGNALVATNMSNMGLASFCKSHGIDFITTAVGDRFVMAAMEAGGYNMGGEQSGHLILRDYSPTGDGQLAAVFLMRILREEMEPLSKLASAMEQYPQVIKAVRVKPATKENFDKSLEYAKLIKATEDRLGNEGRVVVRKSGTESVIRVMVEGRDFELVMELTATISKLIEDIDLNNT